MQSLIPKNSVIILGILIATLPFIGIPGSWKTPLYFLLGAAVSALSYQAMYKKKAHPVRHSHRKRVHEEVVSEGFEQGTEPREETTIKNS